jgi:hypothetical protein
VFAEAERRDPDHRRAWVTLVDGNNHQIPRIEAEARNRSVADRMDITGARWSVSGAEAVLKHEPSAPTATSTPTGATTSIENGNEFTNPATPTRSSLSPHLPPEEPHLKKFVTGCARHCARVIVGSCRSARYLRQVCARCRAHYAANPVVVSSLPLCP